jgi:FMN reductase
MAEILLISGSPTASSKSAALLEYSRTWLHDRSPFESELVSIRDFPAEDLDILPQCAFRGKTILPLASGGSPGHLLAIDYAIKPVLSTLGASDVLQGVYLVDQQFRIENGETVISEEVQQRLDESLAQFVANLEIRTTVR